MEIYLLRHGIAEDGKPGLDDADRALTAEGRRKLRQVLRVAADADLRPDLIFSSSLKRALQTSEIAKEALGYKDRIFQTDALTPGSSPEHVWHEVRAHKDAGSLMLVGHNPLFAQLAAYFLGSSEVQVDFKKGAIMRIDFDSFPARPRGILRWYLTARLTGKE